MLIAGETVEVRAIFFRNKEINANSLLTHMKIPPSYLIISFFFSLSPLSSIFFFKIFLSSWTRSVA